MTMHSNKDWWWDVPQHHWARCIIIAFVGSVVDISSSYRHACFDDVERGATNGARHGNGALWSRWIRGCALCLQR